MNGEKLLKMEMSKLKIRLNFKLFLLFIFFVPLYSLGIFKNSPKNNIILMTLDYSKHIDFNDYNYGGGLGILFKNNLQLDYKYSKINNYVNNMYSNSVWDENSSFYITKFFKNNNNINLSLSLKLKKTIREKKYSTSFLFTVNGYFPGSPGTGMKYYPYIRMEQEIPDDLINVFSDLSNINNTYDNKYFLSIGCYITFNDYWINPLYRKNNSENTIYEGMQIGIWDYIK